MYKFSIIVTEQKQLEGEEDILIASFLFPCTSYSYKESQHNGLISILLWRKTSQFAALLIESYKNLALYVI